MEKPKAILFDMGDTLITYEDFNPICGNEKLMEHACNPYNVSLKTIQSYANKIAEEADKMRETTHIEYSCQSFQRLIFGNFGITFNLSPLELEILFNRHAWHHSIISGTIEMLDYLQSADIRIGILSNATFSTEAIINELDEFGISEYFEFIMSTSDYLLRKPDKRIFDVALAKFDLRPREVWYVGNSFKYDVMGAYNAHMQSIWYNAANKEPLAEIPYYEIRSYDELIRLLIDLSDQSMCEKTS